MWDDSIIKYPGAPFQARRRYGARRIIRKNCVYRGKLRDNRRPLEAAQFTAPPPFCAQAAAGAVPRSPAFFAKCRKAVHGNPGKAQIRKRRRGSAVRTRARTENQARAMRFFLHCRAHCRVSSLTFLRSAEKRFTEIRGSANPEAPARLCRENTGKDGKSGAGQCGSFCYAARIAAFLSAFLWKAQTRRDRAARERGDTDEPHCFLGTSRSRRARTGRQARAAAACDEGVPIYEKGASEQQPDAPLQAMQHYLVSASTLTTCWPS